MIPEGFFELPFDWAKNKYYISKAGDLFSLPKNKLLSKSEYGNGYLFYNLFDGVNFKSRMIHRLVAQTFIPNPENKRTVNHKDGNIKNNNLSNLEWATHSENHLHAYRVLKRTPPNLGKTGERNGKSKPVNQYDLSGNFIKRWDSINLAEIYLGNKTHISECCLGKRKKSKGYVWKYA